MDSVQLIAVFLFIIVVELAILLWIYASLNNFNMSSFDSTKYYYTVDQVQNTWRNMGCNKPLPTFKVDTLRRYSDNKRFMQALEREKRYKNTCGDFTQLTYSFLSQVEEKELRDMWANAGCGNKPFPAQRLNSIFKKSYTNSQEKKIVFESIKSWLNGEIEDMC